jgi:hypothetical protein
LEPSASNDSIIDEHITFAVRVAVNHVDFIAALAMPYRFYATIQYAI